MIIEFIIALFGTLLLIRVLAHRYHDMETYDKKNPRTSQAKTITGWMRRKTGFDWHHIHFGFIILIATIISFFVFRFNRINIIFLAIGLSMISDQITPLIDDKSNYFSKRKLMLSIFTHVFIALIAILLFSFIFS